MILRWHGEARAEADAAAASYKDKQPGDHRCEAFAKVTAVLETKNLNETWAA